MMDAHFQFLTEAKQPMKVPSNFSQTLSVIPKSLLTVINQLCELERKLKKSDSLESLLRNVVRMKDAFEEYGLVYEDPLGQPCPDTRTDVEASIAGPGTEDLVIVQVIKPIVRQRNSDVPGDAGRIVQKGKVVVESRNEIWKKEKE